MSVTVHSLRRRLQDGPTREGLARIRLDAAAEMRRLTDAAGDTPLSGDAARQFDELHAVVRRAQLAEAEGRYSSVPRTVLDGPGVSEPPAGEPFPLDYYGGAEPAARALRADESVAEYATRRQRDRGRADADADAVRLGPGRILRALMLGPRDDAERRALSVGLDSGGGYTVPSVLSGQLIDLMRPQAAVLGAGAKFVPLESDEHSFARVTADPVPSWRGENTEVSEQDVTFGRMTFRPRSVAFVVRASRELIQDASNLEEELPRIFAATMAREIDRVSLYGDGAAEPLGLRYAAGVNEISMAANGAALDGFDRFIRARRLILDSNAAEPNTVIMAPRTGETLARMKDGEGQPLPRPPVLERWMFRETTQVRTGETQGSAQDASSAFVGGFGDVWIGQRLDTRIEVLRERYADRLQVGFLVHARIDTAIRQPGALARIVGIIPPSE